MPHLCSIKDNSSRSNVAGINGKLNGFWFLEGEGARVKRLGSNQLKLGPNFSMWLLIMAYVVGGGVASASVYHNGL